jgi:hypothetical protein
MTLHQAEMPPRSSGPAQGTPSHVQAPRYRQQPARLYHVTSNGRTSTARVCRSARQDDAEVGR